MTVATVPTCLADAVPPQDPIATVRMLEHVGVEVALPDAQSCRGQMHPTTG